MPEIDYEIDAIGLVFPEPLMIARNRVRDMRPGERVRIVATDPSTTRELRNFCRLRGHTLTELGRTDDRLEFVIEKGRWRRVGGVRAPRQ